MAHEIDLLLSCRDIIVEPLEAAVFTPHVGEKRTCRKHGEQEIVKVGTPYWVDDKQKQNDWDVLADMAKIVEKRQAKGQ